jgi:uncharacterized protein involved in exopolysaccharide biosynthesis
MMTAVDVNVPNLSGAQLLRILRRRKYVAILTYVLIVVGAVSYCFFWPPSYAAGVSYLVKHDREEPLVSSDEQSVRTMSRQPLTEEELNDESELIQSQPVIEQTVRDLNIDKLPEHWAIRLLTAPLQFATTTYNDYHHKPNVDSFHGAAERLARKLEVTPGKKSDILEIRVLWGDPDFARQIVERLSVHYQAAHQELHAAPDTMRFYQEQFERAKANLQQIETQMEQIHPGSLLGGLQAEKDLSIHQAAEFEAEWHKAQSRQAELYALLASRTQDLTSIPDRVVTDDKAETNQLALGNLKNQVLDLEMKHQQLAAKYKPENYLVQQSAHQLEEAKHMLAAERADVYHEQTTSTNRVAEALKQDLYLQRGISASNQALLDALKGQVTDYTRRAADIAKDGASLQHLELQRESAREAVLQYARRYEQARIQAAMNRIQIVNVTPIGPVWAMYSPVKPNTPLLLKLTLGAGLLIALGLAIAVDLLQGGIYHPEDLAGIVDAPFVGVLPECKPMTSAAWTGI